MYWQTPAPGDGGSYTVMAMVLGERLRGAFTVLTQWQSSPAPHSERRRSMRSTHKTSHPGAYVIVDISEITNSDGFKQLFPKAPAAVAAFNGTFVTRTEKISALDGTPPKRFVIIGFDDVEKAKAWNASAAQKEINDIRLKNTKSRSFIVAAEGM
jgi:uncharacterized protein (DUF1330 family)